MDFLSDSGIILGLSLVVVAICFYAATRPRPVRCGVDLDSQSVELSGSSRARMSRLCVAGRLVSTYYDDVRTQYDIFQRGRRISGDRPCVGWRLKDAADFQWLTYNQVNERATHFGSGLIQKFGHENRGSMMYVGIHARNKPEWVITEQAVNAYSLALVPLSDTLGRDACCSIINQCEVTTIVCDAVKVAFLLDICPQCPSLKNLIKIGDVQQAEHGMAHSLGLCIVSMSNVEDDGAVDPLAHKPPAPTALSTIYCTSGTTGVPKSAMMTHGNCVAAAASFICHLEGTKVLAVGPDDIHVSFMPLVHVFERSVQAVFFQAGARVGFFQGDVRRLMEDVKILRPTVFPTVPAMLSRIHDQVMSKLKKRRFTGTVFRMALKSKEKEIARGIVRNNSFWDFVVFRGIQQGFGGRLKCVIVGGAPLSRQVLSFCRSVLGCFVIEVYGLTETAGSGTMSLPGDESSSVGPPVPCNQVKLVDVPELDYFAENGEGEICLKGPNIFRGYVQREDMTREVLDEDGWFRTGDIGSWLANGSLKIVDRKIQIFKLAQGDYVAPDKIEQVYVLCSQVSQVFVYGNCSTSHLVSVVVPNPEEFLTWAASNEWSGSVEELCQKQEVREALLLQLNVQWQRANLKEYEMVKAIYIYPERFSVENGLLTSTLKKKRGAIERHFRSEIDNMYQKLDEL